MRWFFRVVVGDGGKTINVCVCEEETDDTESDEPFCISTLCRSDGGRKSRDSERRRVGGGDTWVFSFLRDELLTKGAPLSDSRTRLTGDAGTGGRMLKLTGRRLTLGFWADGCGGEISKVERIAVKGGPDGNGVVLHASAPDDEMRFPRFEFSTDILRGVPLWSSSGEQDSNEESSSV